MKLHPASPSSLLVPFYYYQGRAIPLGDLLLLLRTLSFSLSLSSSF